MSVFGGESPENYEQKCHCVLVLDTSGSMAGDPIAELNQGLLDFQNEVLNDITASNRIEISIITFNSQVQCIQEPALAGNISMPRLQPGGSTRLVDGMRAAMQKLEERKQWYRSTGQTYYRPFIVLITDGEPDEDQDVEGLHAEVAEAVAGKKFNFYALGVQRANMEKLAQICPPNFPPMKMQGLKFREFFRWLSASLSMVSKSKEGERLLLPPTSGWSQVEV
jgi:uncharacterized protein YegL